MKVLNLLFSCVRISVGLRPGSARDLRGGHHRSEPGAVATGFPLVISSVWGDPVATARGSDLCTSRSSVAKKLFLLKISPVDCHPTFRIPKVHIERHPCLDIAVFLGRRRFSIDKEQHLG